MALLGRAHPIGVVGAALLFGVLRAGSGSMQRASDIPVDIISIVQGVILLFVAAQVIIQRLIAPRAGGARPRRQRHERPMTAATLTLNRRDPRVLVGRGRRRRSSRWRCSPWPSTSRTSAASSTG